MGADIPLIVIEPGLRLEKRGISGIEGPIGRGRVKMVISAADTTVKEVCIRGDTEEREGERESRKTKRKDEG